MTAAEIASMNRYDQAALRPSALAPTEEIRTGIEAPTAIPSMSGNAVAKVMTPVKESACRIPTAAEAL